MTYPVVEKFISINGESDKAGELATFIRFKGCNLNCSYCDTKWANEPSVKAEYMTLDEIVEYCERNHMYNITLTGGEPLLVKDIDKLIDALTTRGHRVEIETNGSVSIERLSKNTKAIFTLDYKCPSSGMEKYMLLDNYMYLKKDDAVKFVVGTQEDLLKAYEIIRRYDLSNKCHVFLSPVYGEIEPKDIVQFMIDNNMNNIKLQLQLHKFIWNPDKRGV